MSPFILLVPLTIIILIIGLQRCTYTHHFYDFDETLSVIGVRVPVGDNIEEYVKHLYTTGALTKMFGGTYRINKLHNYFKILRKANVKSYIVSFNDPEVIKQCLKHLDLLNYFTEIHGQNNQSKDTTIKQIMNKYQISSYSAIFMDDQNTNLQLVSKLITVYKANDGLNETDLNYLLKVSL